MSDIVEKSRIVVFKDVLKKLIEPTMSCATICNTGSIKSTFQWEGHNMVATGACWGGRDSGRIEINACEVIPLTAYRGDLEPLEYSEHWDAAGRGLRDRGYNGMLVKHGKQQVVLGREVVFVSRAEAQQKGLFD